MSVLLTLVALHACTGQPPEGGVPQAVSQRVGLPHTGLPAPDTGVVDFNPVGLVPVTLGAMYIGPVAPGATLPACEPWDDLVEVSGSPGSVLEDTKELAMRSTAVAGRLLEVADPAPSGCAAPVCVPAPDCPYDSVTCGPGASSGNPIPMTGPMWNELGQAAHSPGPGLDYQWVDMPEELGRYCVVRIDDGKHLNEDPGPLDKGAVIAPQSTADTGPSATATAEAEFATYAADATSRGMILSASGSHFVRLTLLDTAATQGTDAAFHGEAPHGQALASALNDQLGNNVEVRLRLAMPLDGTWEEGAPFPTWNVSNGGTYGGLDWLAQSIVREVLDWDPAYRRLILNLSLAWPGRAEDGDVWGRGATSHLWRTDVQAVYSALRYARCRGALIVIAAGNRAGGQSGLSQPLDAEEVYPAHWASHEVTATDCTTEFGMATVPFSGSVPLLFPVGGIGLDGQPIAIARPAYPPLMAFARHFKGPEGPVLTGTSVSSAIVAGEAAAWWSNHPTEAADAVMEALWDAACELPESVLPDSIAFPPINQQGASTARAVAFPSAVSQPGGLCDIGEEVPFSAIPSMPGPTTLLQTSPTLSINVFAALVDPGIAYRPFSSPAPVTAGCTTCGIEIPLVVVPAPQASLYVQLDSGTLDATDAQAHLWTTTSPTANNADQSVTLGTLTAGQAATFAFTSSIPFGDVTRAALTFKRTDPSTGITSSYISDLALWPGPALDTANP